MGDRVPVFRDEKGDLAVHAPGPTVAAISLSLRFLQ